MGQVQYYIVDITTECTFNEEKVSAKMAFRQERGFSFTSHATKGILAGEMTSTIWLLNEQQEMICEFKTIVPFTIKANSWIKVPLEMLVFLLKQTVAYGQGAFVFYSKQNNCPAGIPIDSTNYETIKSDFRRRIQELSN